MKQVTLRQQIAEAQRELQMRRNVYPGWVSGGRLAKDQAEHRIACQEAIILSLTGKEYHGEKPKQQAVQGKLF
ncbi:MAG: hypothetical protein RIE86_09335 [Imperialibacter sp.]|uniref:hypothetical protein n=1 Tax=Imperialibacter sp. TaxID=2038411 RepID=UPI0032EB1D4D